MKLFDDLEPWEREALDLLRQVSDQYPFDPVKDLGLLRILREQFPDVDLAEELKQWRVWVMDNPPKAKWNWRARFRTWVNHSEQYRRGTRGRSNAADPAAFGSTRETERW